MFTFTSRDPSAIDVDCLWAQLDDLDWAGLGWSTVAVASSVAEGLFQVCRIFKYVLSDTPQFGAILFDVSVGAQCDALVHFAKDLRKQHTRVLSIPSVCG